MTESYDRLDQPSTRAENKTGCFSSEALSQFAASLSAGVSGAVTFSLVAASRGASIAIPCAMVAGGLTKLSIKTSLESLFVDKQERTASIADLGWGALDGLAGVNASVAERLASRAYVNAIATDALGANITSTMAETASQQLNHSDVLIGVGHSLVRGMAGGAAGTFTWSAPHRIYEHSSGLGDDPAGGALAASQEILTDVLAGTALGGVIAGGGTALMRSNELMGRAGAALRDQPDLLHMRLLHLNDFHSQNDQLPAMKPVSDKLLADAKQNGISAQFVSVGDLEGSNVQYISSKAGMPENSALMQMGVKKFIPGNHTYDLGSKFNVPGYARTMSTLLREHPDAALIATNLDLSAYPDYEQIARRFSIDTVAGPNGPEKVATLGLVTKEGTELGDVAGIGYRDARQSAVQTMLDLANNHGVNKFIILSHLGLGEDQVLAQALVKDADLAAGNLKVAAIISAHTHDATAAPLWVGRNGLSTGGLSTLRNMQAGYEIPIVQAGHNAGWLGQLDLAIRPDGSADRFRTLGRLHAITPNMPRDAALDAYVRSQASELVALRQTDFNARVLGSLTTDKLRSGESELGNLVSDVIDANVKADAVLTHSGWIRTGLESNVDGATGKVISPVTRENIADMFKSGGDSDLEREELHVYQIRGDELRNIFEFSVRKLPSPSLPTFAQRLLNVFSSSRFNPATHENGYFLQVAGIKYDFDLAKNPLTAVSPEPVAGTVIGDGDRIGNISIRQADSGNYLPIAPEQEYSIATRRFIFDKWTRFGIFGGRRVEETAVGTSPVQMVGDFIRNRTIEPSMFRPDGRIVDLTARPSELPLKAGLSMVTAPLLEGWSGQRPEHR